MHAQACILSPDSVTHGTTVTVRRVSMGVRGREYTARYTLHSVEHGSSISPAVLADDPLLLQGDSQAKDTIYSIDACYTPCGTYVVVGTDGGLQVSSFH